MNAENINSDAPVAVSYHLDGQPAEARFLAKEARLVALGISDGERTYAVTSDFAKVLASYPHRRRLYLDATVARQVERRLCLPNPQGFEDFRTRAFLESGGGQWDPITPELTSKGSDPAKEARAIYDVLSGSWQWECNDPQISFLYRNIELPVIEPTVAMMAHGLPIDRNLMQQLQQSACLHIEIQQAELAELRAADLADSTPAQAAGTRLRHYQAEQSAAAAVLTALDETTGCVHPSLDSLGSDTGRFSCSSPAMQGLPSELRKAIIAAPGHQLIEADWCQVELQVLGVLSQDPRLLSALDAGVDIHRQTAALLLGLPIAEITTNLRKIGKALNFGIMYGKTPHGISDDLGISVGEAEALLRDYLAQFPTLSAWLTQTRVMAQTWGYITTYYGRKRVLSDAKSDDPSARAKALRQAVNTKVQGSAAELHKMALVRLHNELPRDCRLLLAMHDGALVAAPQERIGERAATLKHLLEAPFPNFPRCLPVEIKVGDSWGTMAPI